MIEPVRTRIAPSPTGQDLHIGNAYTAYLNYVFAKKHGGQFIVRIEDTDRTRLVAGSEERILASLDWLGIPRDEGPDVGGPYAPYRQSERLPEYKKQAEELVKNGHAFYCFCTQPRLEEMRKIQEQNHQPPMYDGLCKNLSSDELLTRLRNGQSHVIRLNVPDTGVTTFHDVIRGDVSFENKFIDDQVLLKSDGFPTYHLGVVVDDHIMRISHVIRGEEWISSTPKHILLYQFFGWKLPVFAHVSVLRNPDKSKLSKRKNPVWVSYYKEQGFLPEAIKNFFAHMAWSYPSGREIFTEQEMMQAFTLEAVQTTAPVFNQEKLRWMNGEYLRMKSDVELINLLYQHINNLPASWRVLTSEHNKLLKQIIPLIRDRMKILSEFWSLAGFFFEKPHKFEKPLDPKLIQSIKLILGDTTWDHSSMETAIRGYAEKSGLKVKDVFMELRLAVTGKSVGPPLLESLEILGKEETLARLII